MTAIAKFKWTHKKKVKNWKRGEGREKGDNWPERRWGHWLRKKRKMMRFNLLQPWNVLMLGWSNYSKASMSKWNEKSTQEIKFLRPHRSLCESVESCLEHTSASWQHPAQTANMIAQLLYSYKPMIISPPNVKLGLKCKQFCYSLDNHHHHLRKMVPHNSWHIFWV